ncbi:MULTISPECIES: hypothetical protein [Pseudomonas syringae group]|jgi:hypothetical protein|uniref:hypothetical protein n=1 Tax=Pseudomonas syringae group TaxID=136849 RepID=UPI00034A09BF|nr:hypothetical protein [Pseudomonas syringae]MCH5655235.1 hypothetical protein [Pseudomonas syringae]MCK9719429.1 hypothetical protein [Pseudomonas syringae pv. syringae]MCK9763056.1 hypothetical protein [Pseudomonas syringae pv. syringae]
MLTLQPLCQKALAGTADAERVSHSYNYLSIPDFVDFKAADMNKTLNKKTGKQ